MQAIDAATPLWTVPVPITAVFPRPRPFGQDLELITRQSGLSNSLCVAGRYGVLRASSCPLPVLA